MQDSATGLLDQDSLSLNGETNTVATTYAATAAVSNPQPTDNEETKRVNDSIKSLLGIIAKVLAKLPKPVLAIGLGVSWLAPLILDASLEYGTGSILSQIFSVDNIGNIINSALSGVGMYSLYNSTMLYQKADKASMLNDKDLVVKSTENPRLRELEKDNLVLAGKNAYLQEALARKDAVISNKDLIIQQLIAELRRHPQSSEPEIQSMLGVLSIGEAQEQGASPLSSTAAPVFQLFKSSDGARQVNEGDNHAAKMSEPSSPENNVSVKAR